MHHRVKQHIFNWRITNLKKKRTTIKRKKPKTKWEIIREKNIRKKETC